jgi:hypothetical protein
MPFCALCRFRYRRRCVNPLGAAFLRSRTWVDACRAFRWWA